MSFILTPSLWTVFLMFVVTWRGWHTKPARIFFPFRNWMFYLIVFVLFIYLCFLFYFLNCVCLQIYRITRSFTDILQNWGFEQHLKAARWVDVSGMNWERHLATGSKTITGHYLFWFKLVTWQYQRWVHYPWISHYIMTFIIVLH